MELKELSVAVLLEELKDECKIIEIIIARPSSFNYLNSLNYFNSPKSCPQRRIDQKQFIRINRTTQ